MDISSDCRELAEQVSNEMNGAKLTLMITQLCAAIDSEGESKSCPRATDSNPPATKRAGIWLAGCLYK
jgi:hypothetical protein